MFTVKPDDIQRLDDKQLVELLRALVYAEARSAGVPLSGANIPLQITIPDGGEDGSIQWHNGENHTFYFPSRDVVFQCKTTDRGDSQWMKEVWTKKTQAPKVTTKVLSPAIAGALARGAAYIRSGASPAPPSSASPARRHAP